MVFKDISRQRERRFNYRTWSEIRIFSERNPRNINVRNVIIIQYPFSVKEFFYLTTDIALAHD